MFSTWFIVTCSLTCAARVLYTYLELSSCKFLLERVLDPFVHFLYPSLPPRWWAESFISSGVLSVFRFTWNKSLFMPNKWCVLFYWLLACLDIPGEFGKNVCNLASSSPKIPCGMLCCSVYRPLRLDSIDRIFSCPSYLYGRQYVSISNKIPTFLAPKCPSLISRIFFKCSSSENHSKLLMIKIKELRNETTNFPAPKSETESFLGIFSDHFL